MKEEGLGVMRAVKKEGRRSGNCGKGEKGKKLKEIKWAMGLRQSISYDELLLVSLKGLPGWLLISFE